MGALTGLETVLVVEDERIVREVTASILRHEGYVVLEATEGFDAINMAREHSGARVDLLFTDLVLPLMSGTALAERIMQTHPDVRVLFTSGYSPDAVGRREIESNGMAFLAKPFTPDELISKVRAVMAT